MKRGLSFLDRFGFPILYPEQFLIADQQYILDTSKIEKKLSFSERYSDSQMMIEAFEDWKKKSKPPMNLTKVP